MRYLENSGEVGHAVVSNRGVEAPSGWYKEQSENFINNFETIAAKLGFDPYNTQSTLESMRSFFDVPSEPRKY